MMKEHALPEASQEEAVVQTAAIESAGSEQDLLGNQAVLQEMDGQANESEEAVEENKSEDSDSENEVDSFVFGPENSLLEDAAKEHELATKEAEKEAEGPPDLAARAATLNTGMTGAVLGAKATYDVKSDANAEASTSHTIPDGTYGTITEVNGLYFKFEFRKEGAMVSGWLNAAVFSPQPKLAPDSKDTSLPTDANYELAEGDQSPGEEMAGSDIKQGGLGDCFLIASINAIANADPKFLQDAITYDASSGMYSCRFYEEDGFDAATNQPKKKEHIEIVDGYLPTLNSGGNAGKNAYARPNDASQWGAIYEKAYAQWKGGGEGYAKIGTGGHMSAAMEEITGAVSVPQSMASLAVADVIPFFENAQENNLAVCLGSLDHLEQGVQTPLRGSAPAVEAPEAVTEEVTPAVEAEEAITEEITPIAPSEEVETESVTPASPIEEEKAEEAAPVFHPGPYSGVLSVDNSMHKIKQGTVKIQDAGSNVGSAKDTGKYPDPKSEITGSDVKSGEVAYKSRELSLTYNDGKGPAKDTDLEVKFDHRGLIYPAKTVFAWHAYVFKEVKDGMVQLYNPWGSWQPSPMNADEIKQWFSNMSSNKVPQSAESESD